MLAPLVREEMTEQVVMVGAFTWVNIEIFWILSSPYDISEVGDIFGNCFLFLFLGPLFCLSCIIRIHSLQTSCHLKEVMIGNVENRKVSFAYSYTDLCSFLTTNPSGR